jgi:hypothetical protein
MTAQSDLSALVAWSQQLERREAELTAKEIEFARNTARREEEITANARYAVDSLLETEHAKLKELQTVLQQREAAVARREQAVEAEEKRLVQLRAQLKQIATEAA